jgi:hypothetical protein
MGAAPRRRTARGAQHALELQAGDHVRVAPVAELGPDIAPMGSRPGVSTTAPTSSSTISRPGCGRWRLPGRRRRTANTPSRCRSSGSGRLRRGLLLRSARHTPRRSPAQRSAAGRAGFLTRRGGFHHLRRSWISSGSRLTAGGRFSPASAGAWPFK